MAEYSSIRRHENFRSKAYPDIGKKWTIGYGQTEINGRPVGPDDYLPQQQADKEWPNQVAPYAARAYQLVPNATPPQHEALTSIIYNYGIPSSRMTELGRRIREGKPLNDIKTWWLNSDTVQGVHKASLKARREREWALFTGTKGGTAYDPNYGRAGVIAYRNQLKRPKSPNHRQGLTARGALAGGSEGGRQNGGQPPMTARGALAGGSADERAAASETRRQQQSAARQGANIESPMALGLLRARQSAEQAANAGNIWDNGGWGGQAPLSSGADEQSEIRRK